MGEHRGATEGITCCDGALGFQAAVAELWPETRIQRCWFHKVGNVLHKLPKALQGKAKGMLHDQYLAPTREAALKAFDLFVKTFGSKYTYLNRQNPPGFRGMEQDPVGKHKAQN